MGLRDAWKALFRKQDLPKAPRPMRGEVGYTGSRIFAGYPMEEYNTDLAWPKSVEIYDQMRRSDGQVAAVLMAIKLPIRSTKWFVQPDDSAADRKQAQDIADFISENLFGGMKYSWDDHLREALLMLDFGISVFEKVYRFDEWNGRPVIMLDKYAPRVVTSLWRFPQDENWNIVAVEQINYMTGQMVTIPLDKCRVYTYQREGDNIVGISALRPAYKHWYIKDALYKIIAVGVEKGLVGTPYAKLPKGTSEEDRRRILETLTAMRVAEEAGATFPSDVEVAILEGKSNAINAMPFLEHQDTLIARSLLAQFINLGTMSSASGGAYALGRQMVDLFVMALESIANYIQGEVQKDIDDLVAWNFGPDAPVPKLQHKDISFGDMTEIAQALYWLGAGHLVLPDEQMENYIRDLFGLPAIPKEALQNQQITPQSRYNPDITPDARIPMPSQQDIAVAKAIQEMRGSQPAAMSDPARGQAFDDNGGEGPVPAGTTKWRRDLTPYEKLVDFAELNDNWTTAEERMQQALQEIMRKIADDYLGRVQKILDTVPNTADQIRQISALQARYNAQYQQQIQQQLLDAYQAGSKSAAQQLGMEQAAVKTSQAAIAGIKARAQTLADLQTQKLVSAIRLAVLGQLQRGVDAKRTMYNAKMAANAYITGSDLKTSAMVSVGEALNIGRGDTARQKGIQGAQWSAILDSHTCPLCESLDGKVISVDNPDFDIFRPPLHHGCRCVLVYIGQEEEGVKFTWETPPHNLVKKYASLIT